MWNLIIASTVYIASAVCIPIMKKIDPDNKWYPGYVLAICILFTIYMVAYLNIQYG